jgi:hypothetical protein
MKIPDKKNYPKTLMIGGEEYSIKFKRKLSHPDNVGECHSDTREILLKLGESREETFKTLLHECCHAAIEFENNTEIAHKLIYKLEDILYQFLVENF